MDETRPLRKENVRCQELGDEWVLYDQEAGSMHVVNATAGFVWRMCDGSQSLEEMERKLADAYEIPAGTDVRAHLENVIQSFAEQGMLASQEA